MKTIYLVKAWIAYEANDPVRAFTSKKAANAFMKKCEAYHETKPDDFTKEMRWDARHPAKGFHYYHGFSVQAIKLDESA